MVHPDLANPADMQRRDTEPGICPLELTQIMMQGQYPSEQILEYLLDRNTRQIRNSKSDMPTPLDQTPPDTLPTYDAKVLTQNGTLARIVLNNQIYLLRITRSSKLILTK